MNTMISSGNRCVLFVCLWISVAAPAYALIVNDATDGFNGFPTSCGRVLAGQARMQPGVYPVPYHIDRRVAELKLASDGLEIGSCQALDRQAGWKPGD